MLASEPPQMHLAGQDLDVFGVEFFEVGQLRIIERLEQGIDHRGRVGRGQVQRCIHVR